MTKLTCLICTGLAIGTSGVVHAEEHDPEMQGPPTQEPVRSGATVTLSFGPGELHQIPDMGSESRIEGPAFSLRAGAALSASSAFEAMIDFVDGGGGVRSTVIGGSIKFYTQPAFYVRLGGGLGTIALPTGGDPTMGGGNQRFWGPAAVAGVGYEWFQLRDLALFGELALAGNRLVSKATVGGVDVSPDTSIVNIALTFGITWF